MHCIFYIGMVSVNFVQIQLKYLFFQKLSKINTSHLFLFNYVFDKNKYTD